MLRVHRVERLKRMWIRDVLGMLARHVRLGSCRDLIRHDLSLPSQRFHRGARTGIQEERRCLLGGSYSCGDNHQDNQTVA